jgi:membrane-associated protein
MDLLSQLADVFLHLDDHLSALTGKYGAWTYLILCMVVFCETGLVIAPILPGDSLLFAVGAMAAIGVLDFTTVALLLTIAAIAGDAVNYACGHFVGPKVFRRSDSRLWKREYLDRTHRFYLRHGGKTIVLARFLPIIRTFAPFVAGVGRMPYGRFAAYNVVGAIAWVGIFVSAGYAFGSVPVIRDNIALVAVGIVVVSVLPIVVEVVRSRLKSRQTREQHASAVDISVDR